jgi:hypothetical protein
MVARDHPLQVHRRCKTLLRRLELTGALVKIDAMGTQKEIAQTIHRWRRIFRSSIEENWPATCAEVEKVFADPAAPPNEKRCTLCGRI